MAKVAKRRGRYVLDYYDHKGQRHWQTLHKGTTKKAAKEKLREIEIQIDRGTYIPDNKIMTFGEVAEAWLEQKKTNVRASTWGMYKRHVELHLKNLHHFRVNRITVAMIEKHIIQMRSGKHSIGTVRKMIITANQVMQYAVRHRMIDYNPVKDAERPKADSKEKGEIKILTSDQIKTLLESTKDAKYKTLFMLAAFSGARQGELLGLKWSDIDYDQRQIAIRRTFNCGQWYAPKSTNSKRKIDLGPSMMEQLRKWQKVCPESEFNLVFPTRSGGPIDANNLLKKIYRPVLETAKLPNVNFHSLRHSYASLMIDLGFNIVYISRQLGHANPTITLNVYAHLIRDTNDQAPLALENSVFTQTGSKMVATGQEPQKMGLAVAS